MSLDTIKKLKETSQKDTSWLEQAQYRQDNEDWLDLSFQIAVRVMSTLKEKKISQKEFAESLGCSPQYVSKLLKGAEKLQIDTICKIQRILAIKLIEIPQGVSQKEVQYTTVLSHSLSIVSDKEANPADQF